MPRYQYVKIPGHRHPVTLSYEVTTGPTDPSLMMVVGVAFCHNKDPFNKEFGRKIADGRRAKTPHYVGFADQDATASFGKRIVDSLHRWVDSSWREVIKEA